MPSLDENPGFFTFMIGVIVVVMGGVGLSLIVDRRHSVSRSVVGLKREVHLDSIELERLSAVSEEKTRRLLAIGPIRKMRSDAFNSTQLKLESLDRRRKGLAAELVVLESEMSGIEKDFFNYRSNYRDATWAAAVGESIGSLKVRGGREFHDVVISQVTAVGLEIRHRHGLARVQAPDLESSMQERFQWDDEERRDRLNEEFSQRRAMNRAPISGGVEPIEVLPSMVRDADGFDSEALEKLRERVRGWRSKERQLDSERNAAISAASSVGKSSVPSSLETWQGRSDRLTGELFKARSALAAAKVSLARVAPNDPLLREDTKRH